jgi:hypothetical protein
LSTLARPGLRLADSQQQTRPVYGHAHFEFYRSPGPKVNTGIRKEL